MPEEGTNPVGLTNETAVKLSSGWPPRDLAGRTPPSTQPESLSNIKEALQLYKQKTSREFQTSVRTAHSMC